MPTEQQNQQHQNPKTVKWNPEDFPTPEKPEVGIEFFNINSGEKRIADSEALITAFYNSSNLHVNAMVGQDFGWRIAPATVKRMRDIRDDEAVMDRIVARFKLTEISEVTDPHLLTYMFQEDMKRKAREEDQNSNSFARQYEAELRALDEEEDAPETTTGDSPDPLQKAAKARATRAPKLTGAAKKAAQQQAADAKRREDNLANGRDINDGIELSPQQKAALGESSNEIVANSDESEDNDSQS